MANEKRYKPIENYQGTGEVYKEDERLAKVSYNLNIQQKVSITRDFNGTQEIEGLKYRTGSIYVQEGKIDILDTVKRLTLKMDNGKKVDFFIQGGDANIGRFPVLLAGEFY